MILLPLQMVIALKNTAADKTAVTKMNILYEHVYAHAYMHIHETN